MICCCWLMIVLMIILDCSPNAVFLEVMVKCLVRLNIQPFDVIFWRRRQSWRDIIFKKHTVCMAATFAGYLWHRGVIPGGQKIEVRQTNGNSVSIWAEQSLDWLSETLVDFARIFFFLVRQMSERQTYIEIMVNFSSLKFDLCSTHGECWWELKWECPGFDEQTYFDVLADLEVHFRVEEPIVAFLQFNPGKCSIAFWGKDTAHPCISYLAMRYMLCRSILDNSMCNYRLFGFFHYHHPSFGMDLRFTKTLQNDALTTQWVEWGDEISLAAAQGYSGSFGECNQSMWYNFTALTTTSLARCLFSLKTWICFTCFLYPQ